MTQRLAKTQKDLEDAWSNVQDNREDEIISKRNKIIHIIYVSIILLLLIVVGASFFFNPATKVEREDETDILKRDSLLESVEKTVINKVFKNSQLNTFIYTGMVNSLGEPNGKGKAVFTNGDTFVGFFIKGDLRYGKYTWSEDKSYFEGGFTNNEPDEKIGAYYDKNGIKQK